MLQLPSQFISHSAFLVHGRANHPENFKRLNAILTAFETAPALLRQCLQLDLPRKATRDELLLVHTASYVDHVLALAGLETELDSETPLSAGSVDAALLAVGTCLHLLESILNGKVQNGMALVRPPGHHARPGQGMGFCVFNNIALTAARTLALGLKRVCILDWDVHHGNGTQDAFYNDHRVLFIDLHQDDLFPKNSGSADEIGAGKGKGYTLNIPLPHSTDDAGYLRILEEVVKSRVFQFKPELILVSAGFDAHISDPLGSMSLTDEGYRAMTRVVKAWAQELCDGRLMMTLEGGYEPTALAKNVLACGEVLASIDLDRQID